MSIVKKSGWARVKRSAPCPVCEHGDWCRRTNDGAVVHCMRIASDRTAPKGGWYHRMNEPLPTIRRNEAPQAPAVVTNWSALAEEMFRAPGADAERSELAHSLGLSVDSLERLGVGIGRTERGGFFWSFPERDADGLVRGIVRRFRDGGKFGMKGGHHGLYFEDAWGDVPGPVLCPEGGSDTAAMLTMELAAVGRPSNVGGVDELVKLLAKTSKPVVVVGENDQKPDRRGTVEQCPADCPGCSWCWPGRYGAQVTAERLAKALGRRVDFRMVNGAKDSREWVRKNGTDGAAFLESLRVPRKWIEMVANG